MKICLSLVFLSQMINKTGDVKYEIFCVNTMCGFNHIWLSHNVVNEDIFMLEFKQRVIDTFLNEAISFFEESPKCHFYKYIYDDHNLQFYLSRPVNYMFKQGRIRTSLV